MLLETIPLSVRSRFGAFADIRMVNNCFYVKTKDLKSFLADQSMA